MKTYAGQMRHFERAVTVLFYRRLMGYALVTLVVWLNVRLGGPYVEPWARPR